MEKWKFDREAELERLKSVARDMAEEVGITIVENPEKERDFLAAANPSPEETKSE